MQHHTTACITIHHSPLQLELCGAFTAQRSALRSPHAMLVLPFLWEKTNATESSFSKLVRNGSLQHQNTCSVHWPGMTLAGNEKFCIGFQKESFSSTTASLRRSNVSKARLVLTCHFRLHSCLLRDVLRYSSPCVTNF